MEQLMLNFTGAPRPNAHGVNYGTGVFQVKLAKPRKGWMGPGEVDYWLPRPYGDSP